MFLTFAYVGRDFISERFAFNFDFARYTRGRCKATVTQQRFANAHDFL